MPDKYKFCGFEIVPEGVSPRGTKAFAEAHKLKGMQREARPTYTATLEDMQRQLHNTMGLPGWMLEPKEARPQDMAIWRAMLAGRSGFVAVPNNAPHAVSAWRKYCLMHNRAPNMSEKQERRGAFPGSGFTCYRFVLFTHPFTGGRAVFSEPVE